MNLGVEDAKLWKNFEAPTLSKIKEASEREEREMNVGRGNGDDLNNYSTTKLTMDAINFLSGAALDEHNKDNNKHKDSFATDSVSAEAISGKESDSSSLAESPTATN